MSFICCVDNGCQLTTPVVTTQMLIDSATISRLVKNSAFLLGYVLIGSATISRLVKNSAFLLGYVLIGSATISRLVKNSAFLMGYARMKNNTKHPQNAELICVTGVSIDFVGGQ